MNPEDLPGPGIDDHLHEAIGVGVGDGAAERREGELANLHLASLLLGLLGGQSRGRNLGIAEDHGRDAADVHLGPVSRDHLGHHLCLVRGLVRQHGLTHEIADRVDASDVGLQATIDGNEPALA